MRLIQAVEAGEAAAGYDPVRLVTSQGVIEARHHRGSGTRRGVVLVGGVGGGFDSPAADLYATLASGLPAEGVTTLRVRFRDPHDLAAAAYDVRAGLEYLAGEGMEAAAVVGHSFGGAAAIRAAVEAPAVRTVVTLATQSAGTERAGELAPRCSLLLIHGGADDVIPPSASEMVYHLAQEPRRLILMDRSGHGLEETADRVHLLVRNWILAALAQWAESSAS